MLIINQLEKLIDKCNQKNIKICLLKGSALIFNDAYKIWERDMEDVDILIKRGNLKKFESLIDNLGYRKVCSGEMGFYKEGENAIIDVHTDILYADEGKLNEIWESMKNIKDAKVMDKEEHFIYIMHHGLIQHGNYTGQWKRDIKRLMESDINWNKLINRLNNYNLTELFCIAMRQLGKPVLHIKHNSLKRKYIEFILSLPSFHDKGHFLRPVTVRGIKGIIVFFVKFIFPDLGFLKRRYHFRPASLMLFLRPFLLVLKMLQGAFSLNPFKRCIKT